MRANQNHISSKPDNQLERNKGDETEMKGGQREHDVLALKVDNM